MGSKMGAKELMRAAGVPTLPSVTVDDGEAPDPAEVEGLGWPLLVKASAGGGGRGMRVVADPDGLADALAGARREALAAFGDGTVFLERYVTPRATSRSRCSPTPTGGRWPCSSGSAASSAATRRSSRRRRRPPSRGAPGPAVRGRGGRGPGRRLRQRRDGGVRARRRRRALLPRDEHPPPGGAPRDRGGHGARPGPAAAAVAGGPPLPPEVARGRRGGPPGTCRRGPPLRRGPGRGWLPSTGTCTGSRWVPTGRRRVRGSTAASWPATWSAPTTTPCWPRSSSTPPPGPRPSADWPPRWPTPASTASPPTATCWCARCATGVRTGATDTGFLDRHGLDVLAAPLAGPEARTPRRGRRPGRPGPPPGRDGPGLAAVGMAQQHRRPRRTVDVQHGRPGRGGGRTAWNAGPVTGRGVGRRGRARRAAPWPSPRGGGPDRRRRHLALQRRAGRRGAPASTAPTVVDPRRARSGSRWRASRSPARTRPHAGQRGPGRRGRGGPRRGRPGTGGPRGHEDGARRARRRRRDGDRVAVAEGDQVETGRVLAWSRPAAGEHRRGRGEPTRGRQGRGATERTAAYRQLLGLLRGPAVGRHARWSRAAPSTS